MNRHDEALRKILDIRRRIEKARHTLREVFEDKTD